MNKRILRIALSKVKHFDERVWCGALTPCEILALVEDGAIPNYSLKYWEWEKKCLEDDIREGISYQKWFYFEKEGLIKND